jgi:hypothetical protein
MLKERTSSLEELGLIESNIEESNLPLSYLDKISRERRQLGCCSKIGCYNLEEQPATQRNNTTQFLILLTF